MSTARLLAIGAAVTIAACEAPTAPVSGEPPLGNVQVAIAGEAHLIPFHAVQCTTQRDHELVELLVGREVGERKFRPRALIARVRGAEVLEAHAFMPQSKVGESEYEMLVLVAKTLPDATKPECRVDLHDEGERTLVCNRTSVVPWLDPGRRPTASFKVDYRCP